MSRAFQTPHGWRTSLLDSVSKRGSGHTPNKKIEEYWNGGIKWVSLADSAKLDSGYIWETDKEISDRGIANSSAVIHPAGTVIMSRDAGVGKSAILSEPMAVSQHFIAWDCGHHGALHNWFLYNWLQFHKEEFERQAVGSTIKTIGLPYFKRLQVSYPPMEEQRRIAEILCTWDLAISRAESLASNIRLQKLALLELLLSGKKRLSGFAEPWKLVKLGDAFSERDERNPGGMILLSVTQGEGIITQNDAGRRNISSEDTSGYKVVQTADIAYNTMRMWQGASGVSAHCGIVSPAYTVVTSKNGHVPDFYGYLFKLRSMMHVFERHSQGLVSDTWNLKFPLFSKIEVAVPSEDEQRKIAEVLKTQDRELAKTNEMLAKLRAEKAALMQQLLSGKRRVSTKKVAA